MSQEDAQSLGRDAKGAGPDTQEDSDTSDQELDALRTKRFKFYSVGSV